MVVADDKLDAREAAPLQPETSSTTCRAGTITNAVQELRRFYDRRDPRRDAALRSGSPSGETNTPGCATGSANVRRAGRDRGAPLVNPLSANKRSATTWGATVCWRPC